MYIYIYIYVYSQVPCLDSLALLLAAHSISPATFFAHVRCGISNLRHIVDELFLGPGPRSPARLLCRRVGGPSASYCHVFAQSMWRVHRALGWDGFTCRRRFLREQIYVYTYMHIYIQREKLIQMHCIQVNLFHIQLNILEDSKNNVGADMQLCFKHVKIVEFFCTQPPLKSPQL